MGASPNGLKCVTCCPWRFKLMAQHIQYAKILTTFTTQDCSLQLISLFVEVIQRFVLYNGDRLECYINNSVHAYVIYCTLKYNCIFVLITINISLHSIRLVLLHKSIYIIIGEVERNSNQNSKLEFQFCAMCPKLFILKELYFLILESNVGPHHKYSSK